MTFLVTGATGNVGRHVVEQLVAAGVPTRALTRNPDKANLPAGAEVLAADLTRTDSLARAFEGVTGVHLINFGGDSYELLDNGPEIVDLAIKAGVKKVSLLGAWDRGSIDEAVEASMLHWTRVMPGEFMSNALDWAEAVRTTGIVEEPFPDAHSPMSHEADIAEIAVQSLLEDGHHAKNIQVAAPTSISLRDKLRILGEAIGKEIKLVELTPEQSRERDAANGVSQELSDFKINVFGNLPTEEYQLEGAAEFAAFTGHASRDFRQWAVENADRFRS